MYLSIRLVLLKLDLFVLPAEDGIRDRNVTGVQTCALPISIDDICTAPLVLARFKSSHPEAKTIIFYNHYDTVPADDDQPWTSNPFELTVRDGYMYGRGVDDDKGHITARLTAVQKYRRQHGDLPVNVIFLMEGAEESASVGLETYLEKYADELRGADLLVWEQGISNAKGQIEISGGTKGI